MAARNLLHKIRFDEFMLWCATEKGLLTRAGTGDYQLGQVQPKGSGDWCVFYSRLHMPEHVTVPERLVSLVRNFIQSTKEKP